MFEKRWNHVLNQNELRFWSIAANISRNLVVAIFYAFCRLARLLSLEKNQSRLEDTPVSGPSITCHINVFVHQHSYFKLP